MNYIVKVLFLTFIVIATFFQYAPAFADNSQQYENKAIQFMEALKTESSEKIYSFLSDELKSEAKPEQIQSIAIQLKGIVSNAEDLELIRSEANVRGPNSYELIYNFTSRSIPYEYKVHLVETNYGPLISGFDFFATVPDKLFSFKYATYKHYLVFSLFTACIIVQVACLLFFIFKNGLKRKWLYVCSAFVGAPVGIGINWITGAFTVSFGFYIPAERVFWPAANPAMPSVFVYFPLGVIFLTRILVLQKYGQVVKTSNSLTRTTENIGHEID